MTSRQDQLDPAVREAQQAERKLQDEHRLDKETEDFAGLMDLRWGRRIVFALLEEAGVFRCSFQGDNRTDFREGRRSIGLKYLAMATSRTPDEFMLMLKEHKDDDRERSASK